MFVDLKHRGLMDNTVVVVTTDNGGGPWDSNAPLRGTKVHKVCYAFMFMLSVILLFDGLGSGTLTCP